jgi:hypothetical protein
MRRNEWSNSLAGFAIDLVNVAHLGAGTNEIRRFLIGRELIGA